jgi:hypothetical protein
MFERFPDGIANTDGVTIVQLRRTSQRAQAARAWDHSYN